MNPFIASFPSLWVAQEQQQSGGGLFAMVPFILMFAVMYFILIRPQSKQRRQHMELLNSLKKDDEVVTSAGMYGKVVALDDKVATLELAHNVKVKILKSNISGKWNLDAAQKS